MSHPSAPKNRPEYTFEEFTQLPMPYVYGVRRDNGATRVYVNSELGFQRTLNTPFSQRTQEWGKGKSEFFVFGADGDEDVFFTVEELYMAYMCFACGVDYDLSLVRVSAESDISEKA